MIAAASRKCCSSEKGAVEGVCSRWGPGKRVRAGMPAAALGQAVVAVEAVWCRESTSSRWASTAPTWLDSRGAVRPSGRRCQDDTGGRTMGPGRARFPRSRTPLPVVSCGSGLAAQICHHWFGGFNGRRSQNERCFGAPRGPAWRIRLSSGFWLRRRSSTSTWKAIAAVDRGLDGRGVRVLKGLAQKRLSAESVFY